MAGAIISTCGTCGLVFASVEAFDFHRVDEKGKRRCLTETELRLTGMRQEANGHWRMPVRQTASRSKRARRLSRKSA